MQGLGFYFIWILVPILFRVLTAQPSILVVAVLALLLSRWLPDPIAWIRVWSRLQKLQSILEINPADQDARFELAETLLTAKQPKRAWQIFSELLPKIQTSDELMLLSARIKIAQGRREEGISDLASLVKKNPKFKLGVPQLEMAKTEYLRGDWGACLDHLRLYVQLNSSDLEAYYLMAVTSVRLEQLEEAEKSAQEGRLTYHQIPDFLKRKSRLLYWGLLTRLYLFKIRRPEPIIIGALCMLLLLGVNLVTI